MARNQEPIKVKAFVTIDGKEVDMDTLSPEVRNRIGAELKVAWMNAMFRGQAIFSIQEEKKPASST